MSETTQAPPPVEIKRPVEAASAASTAEAGGTPDALQAANGLQVVLAQVEGGQMTSADAFDQVFGGEDAAAGTPEEPASPPAAAPENAGSPNPTEAAPTAADTNPVAEASAQPAVDPEQGMPAWLQELEDMDQQRRAGETPNVQAATTTEAPAPTAAASGPEAAQAAGASADTTAETGDAPAEAGEAGETVEPAENSTPILASERGKHTQKAEQARITLAEKQKAVRELNGKKVEINQKLQQPGLTEAQKTALNTELKATEQKIKQAEADERKANGEFQKANVKAQQEYMKTYADSNIALIDIRISELLTSPNANSPEVMAQIVSLQQMREQLVRSRESQKGGWKDTVRQIVTIMSIMGAVVNMMGSATKR